MGTYCDANQEHWLFKVFGNLVGTAVDVGAHDGSLYSNTLLLEERGWKVLCVEPNPDCETALREKRKSVEIVACGANSRYAPFWINDNLPASASSLIPGRDVYTRQIEVQVVPLHDLLLKHGFQTLDLVSIDVEGSEVEVLDGLGLDHWRPNAVIAELLNDGANVIAHLAAHGYRLDEITANDGLFLRT